MHDTLTPVNTLKSVWEEYETVTLDRVALVMDAVERLTAGHLPDPEREQARRAAHMLAGSVGMFGFKRSSEAASALEAALETGHAPDQAQAQTLSAHVATMRHEGLEPRDGHRDPLPGVMGST